VTAADAPLVLAIDLGTGGPKVALVDLEGTIVAHDHARVGLTLLPQGGAEQDPDEWWAAITTATRRMLSGTTIDQSAINQGAINKAAITAVSVTSQWMGAVPVDASGRALMNAIIWLDARTVVLPFLGFAWVIGSAVHVHHIAPDIRWWKKSEWTKFKGQMEGTTVLRVPKGVNFFLHWIMIHVPHHVDMRVPMYHLEAAAEAIETAFPGTVIDKPLRFSDLRHNAKACKLYSFDEGRWFTYAEGRRRLATTSP